MERLEVYVDKPSLEAFLDWYRQSLQKGETNDLVLWSNYASLMKASDLLLQLSQEDFEALFRENILFRRMLKSGTCNPLPHEQTFQNMIDREQFFGAVNPRALFLLAKPDAEERAFEEDFGLLLVGEGGWKRKASSLFSYFSQTVTKGQEHSGNWDWLADHLVPQGNALILVDPYLFANEDRWENNLASLLANLMPATLNRKDYHLLIVTKAERESRTARILKNCLRKVEALVKGLPFHYTVKVTIAVGTGLHERFALSNYFWLSSGYGFVLYKNNKALKTSQVNGFSVGSASSATGAQVNRLAGLEMNRLIEEVKRSLAYLGETGTVRYGSEVMRMVAGPWPHEHPLLE